MPYISQTKSWLLDFVIGKQLCPFAAHPFKQDLIRYQVFLEKDMQQFLELVNDELDFLTTNDPETVETSLIICPNYLEDFLAYLDVVDLVNRMIKQKNLEGDIQCATFHPKYQFGGTDPDDAENFTNRSPYPMFHFLREFSVEKAIEYYDGVEEIPEKNIEKMNELGANQLEVQLKKYQSKI